MKSLGEVIRKVPGFRSGKWWKSLLASVGYLFLFFLFIIIISPSPISLAVDNPKPTNKDDITIEGRTDEPKQVYLMQEGKEVKHNESDSDGKFIFTLNDLPEGNFTYTVKACNSKKKKNCETKNIVVEIDRFPPSKPIIALPKELPDVENEEVVISGKTEPGSKVIAEVGDQGKEAQANEEGEFEVKTGLVLGVNTIKVKAVDEAGNESELAEKEVEFKPTKKKVKVTRVIDGDTIEIEGGQKIRYIGIDTPETGDCFSQKATDKNKDLVGSKDILIEKDVSETDRYGRLLRYIWSGDKFVNKELVKEGYAQVSTYPPDVKYKDNFLEAQRLAKENNRGLWGNVCGAKAIPTSKPVPTNIPLPTRKPTVEPTHIPTQSTEYSCDCSKYCSQMSSCEEAYYQLSCGCSARDGDGDGVPCESICSGGDLAPQPTDPPVNNSSSGNYRCNCSKTCGEMVSCDEAYYQLNTCGCSRRDGDNDGVPCESLCN